MSNDPRMSAEHAGQILQDLACQIDRTVNGANFNEARNGFCLMVFPLDSHMGRCNFISNAAKDDLISIFKTQVGQWDGSYLDREGHG